MPSWSLHSYIGTKDETNRLFCACTFSIASAMTTVQGFPTHVASYQSLVEWMVGVGRLKRGISIMPLLLLYNQQKHRSNDMMKNQGIVYAQNVTWHAERWCRRWIDCAQASNSLNCDISYPQIHLLGFPVSHDKSMSDGVGKEKKEDLKGGKTANSKIFRVDYYHTDIHAVGNTISREWLYWYS